MDRDPDAVVESAGLPVADSGARLAFALGSVLAFVAAFVALHRLTLDDAYIALRYASNAAHGNGLVYNLGEKIEGYTSFLWVVLEVPAFLLGLSPVAWVKALGAVSALLTARCAWRLHTRISESGISALAAACSALPLAVPWVALSAASGLEDCLAMLLVTWMAERLVAEAQQPGRGFPWSAVLAGLLVLTRPDFVLFLPVVVLVQAATLRTPRYSAAWFAVAGVIVAVHLGWRHHYYGYWVPNTFYAKGGGHPDQLLSGVVSSAYFALYSGAWVLPALLAVRRPGVAATARYPIALLVSLITCRYAFNVWSGGPTIGYHRFLVPVLPITGVVIALIADAPGAARKLRRAAAFAAAIGVLGLVAWTYSRGLRGHTVANAEGLERAHVALGRLVARSTTPDAVIAMDDAGAAPFFGGRTTIDMAGLNDAHIAHRPGRFMRDKYDTDYVLGREPDIIVLIADGPQPRGDSSGYRLASHRRLVTSSRFQSSYTLAKVFRAGDGYYLQAYRRTASQRLDLTQWGQAPQPGPGASPPESPIAPTPQGGRRSPRMRAPARRRTVRSTTRSPGCSTHGHSTPRPRSQPPAAP